MDHFPESADHDGESPVDHLHAYVVDSDFDTVGFDILDATRPDVMVTEADREAHTLSIWKGPKTAKAKSQGVWCTINGTTYPIDPAAVDMGLTKEPFGAEEWEDLNDAIRALHEIHQAVEPFYQSQVMEARTRILTALDGVAEHALDLRDADDEDEDDDREDWEHSLDAFTEQCRTGMFAGVSVDESPNVPGALNISAAVMDHVTHQPVKLKVFFRPAADGGEVPDHWMAIGDIEVLAHGVEDDRRSELLAGFPQESREFLLHAVDHLHEMVHEAADVVMARSDVPYQFAEATGMPHDDEVENALTAMSSHAEADALAALNGVARLYTGTLPPQL